MARTVFTSHKWLQIPDEDLGTYNLWDTQGTALSIAPLIRETKGQGMWDFWTREVWPLVPAVLHMQRRGIVVDRQRLRDYRKELEEDLAALDEEILAADPTGSLREPTPKYPNSLGSVKKLGSFLFDTLGLKATKFSERTGDPSTDQDALLKLYNNLRKKDEHARPVIYNLFHRSRLKTIYQRYLRFEVDPDGRVRPTVKMNATETGRFAYERPPLQQYPGGGPKGPEARSIFTAAEGCLLLGADYSQLEARIKAYLAGDEAEIEVYEDPTADIHTTTMQELFGWSDAQLASLTKEERTAARDFAKTFRYGALLYGGNPATMKSKLFCPCPRCEGHVPPGVNLPKVKIIEATQRYFSKHPKMLYHREALAEQVTRHRYLTNPFGRKRFFFGPWREVKREAWNWPIQSTAADLINRAMRRAYERWEAPFFLQMHDYLGVEVPEAEAPLWLDRLKEVMEAPVPELGGVSFPVEAKVEKPWGVKVDLPGD